MRWWRSRARTPLPRIAAVVVAAASVIALGAAGPAAAVDGAPAIHYVALGDSRAAGPTVGSQLADEGCGRTSNGYPNLIAAALSPATFTDVACGGATTADVVDRDQITNPPVRKQVPVQSSVLRPDTTLVTLSIGGNDLRWRGLLTPCFGTPTSGDRFCRDDPGIRSTMEARFVTLASATDRVLQVIRQRSPIARIVVLGHGGYFGSQGCWPDAQLSAGDATFVRSFFDRFDNVLAGSALRNNATYVDVAAAAESHDACATAGERWFTGSVRRGQTPPNHPTPAGSAAMARLVLAALGT
ncbi:SGNH/GDSL hydrolase family protein [Williamsia maris]|uniref:GDSL-like Lipase/Acylhydrolase family protein n=1 Tax=Williamsia maris TaxID=72806 RepID=A0ABT1H8X7_9NOCA|nr:SGNH/GDSL hydrolase family protein [Williamsia maris]MCP2174712.1 GDSL-like Lipase/Acylhydrolase family protein [Williamsia maris]